MSDSPRNSDQLELINIDPEIKAFVFQVLTEFEPFITEQTLLAVVAKDPLRLYRNLAKQGQDVNKSDFVDKYRISIQLQEEGSKLEEEGLHEDIYQAIIIAKDKMLKSLATLHDEIVSQKDRNAQINQVKSSAVH